MQFRILSTNDAYAQRIHNDVRLPSLHLAFASFHQSLKLTTHTATIATQLTVRALHFHKRLMRHIALSITPTCATPCQQVRNVILKRPIS